MLVNAEIVVKMLHPNAEQPLQSVTRFGASDSGRSNEGMRQAYLEECVWEVMADVRGAAGGAAGGRRGAAGGGGGGGAEERGYWQLVVS